MSCVLQPQEQGRQKEEETRGLYTGMVARDGESAAGVS